VGVAQAKRDTKRRIAMKAVQFAHFGERDVLDYIDVATPKPKNDDLLIEVSAAGVNFVDIRERMGYMAAPRPTSATSIYPTYRDFRPSEPSWRLVHPVTAVASARRSCLTFLLVVATRNSPWHLPSFRSSSLLQSM
jgi:hypothetical protein